MHLAISIYNGKGYTKTQLLKRQHLDDITEVNLPNYKHPRTSCKKAKLQLPALR